MNSQNEEPLEAATGNGYKAAVKVPLFILNLITWICGGGMIGLGIWVITTDNDYNHFAENKNVFIVYISFSAMLFTAGILGACGTLLGNKCLLQMYFSLVCLVFCAMFGVVVFALVQKNLVTDLMQEKWNKTSDETRIFIQEKFDCCGINDDATYTRSNLHESCFTNSTAGFITVKQNCLSRLIDWFKEHQLTISLCGSSLMLLMVLLMVSSCWLIHQTSVSKMIKKRNRVTPIVDDDDHGRPARRARDEKDVGLSSVEEPGEDSSSQGRKGKEKQSRKQHSNQRESWAKHYTRYPVRPGFFKGNYHIR